MTPAELTAKLAHFIHVDKPVLVDTGDGILKIESVLEEPHEIVIYLGDMP